MGLTKTETAILANAARRNSLNLLPLPRFIFVRGLAIVIAIEKLLRLGLVKERQAIGDEPVWHSGRVPMTLTVTESGLAALTGTDAPQMDEATSSIPAAPAAWDRLQSPEHMLSEDERHLVLMSIMSRPHGADVKMIQQETGLPLHSVRAAINSLRAEGYVFDHVRDAVGTTTYQLIGWLPGDGGLIDAPMEERLHA